MISQLVRLTKHSTIYGIGHILGRSISLLLMPIHTNYFPPDDYAAYVFGYAFIAVGAVFYSAGINAAQIKYFLASNSLDEKREIMSTSFWGTAFITLLFSLIVLLDAPHVAKIIFGDYKHTTLVYWSVLILSIDALTLLLFNLLRAEEKSLEFISYNLLNVIVNIGLNIYLIIILKTGIVSIFVANAVSGLLTFILLLFVSRTYLKFRFKLSLLKKLLVFGAPIIPSALGMVILLAIDRFFIGAYIGDEAVGLYGAAYRLGMFMSLIVTAFKYAWHPFYLSIADTDSKATDVFARVLTYFLLVTCLIFILIAFFIHEIVRIKIFGIMLFGEKYWPGIPIVPAILASYIFYGIFLNLQVGPYVQNKTYFLVITTSLSATINIVLNMIWIPKMGLMGAALATLVAYFVLAFSLYLLTRRTYKVKYEWGRILKLTIITIACFYTGAYIINDLSIVFRILIILLIPVLLLITGFFSRSELTFARHFIFRKIRRS